MMIEPILGVTRVKSITSYATDERRSQDSFKKKPTAGASFQEILNSKHKAEQAQPPYQLTLKNNMPII